MSAPLLEARGLVRTYPPRGGDRHGRPVRAIDGVDIVIDRGETVGVVGESGSGKSTLARLLLALEPPDHGTLRIDGRALEVGRSGHTSPSQHRVGAVFQDADGSLNPRLRVSTLVAEPILGAGAGSTSDRRARVAGLLAEVGLPPDVGGRLPGALSGGERQRVAIARALAATPDLLVLDEPVSALDVTVGARVLALLDRLRRRHELAILLISHDLGVVARFCARALVMYRGRVVERGPAAEILASPRHPYTRRLVEARPRLDGRKLPPPPAERRSTGWAETACRFAPRCPLADDICRREPGLREEGGRAVACWRPSD